MPGPGPAAPPDARPGDRRELRHPGAAQRQEMVGVRCGHHPQHRPAAGCDRSDPQGQRHHACPAAARRRSARAWPRRTPAERSCCAPTDVTIGYPGNPLFTVHRCRAAPRRVRRADRPERQRQDHLPEDAAGPDGAAARARCSLGASLKIGYFAQAHDGLNGDHTRDR